MDSDKLKGLNKKNARARGLSTLPSATSSFLCVATATFFVSSAVFLSVIHGPALLLSPAAAFEPQRQLKLGD